MWTGVWRGRRRPRNAGSRISTQRKQRSRIQPVRIDKPSHAPRSDSSNAVRNTISLAQFCGAFFQQADQRPVHIAEAKKAEIEGADGYPITCVCSGVILYSTRTSPGWP